MALFSLKIGQRGSKFSKISNVSFKTGKKMQVFHNFTVIFKTCIIL